MIKVYLDWNIISEMKNGFNDELFNSNVGKIIGF